MRSTGLQGGGGRRRYSISLLLELICLRIGNVFMSQQSQLDKLLEIAAEENQLTKRELFIRGRDMTFWSRPTTISEFQAAKKASKNPEDFLEYTVRLFVMKALDQTGQRQFTVEAIPVLMGKGEGRLSMKTATEIMAALNPDEDAEDEALDMKSAEEGSQAA